MTTQATGGPARADMQPLLTITDLERLLRVDKRTIARLCKRGHIPQPFKLGGSNRWRPETVAAAIALLETGRASESAEVQ